MFNTLSVFDFDGTLFRNPEDTPENRRRYEKSAGIPWLIDKDTARRLSKQHGRNIGPRRGWYGRPETLEPPLVPDPVPEDMFIKSVCDSFLQSKADPWVVTVLMTGRHAGIKNQVLRICGDGGLVNVNKKTSKEGKTFFEVADPDVRCYFLGDDGPVKNYPAKKPGETLPWKFWVIHQLLEFYPEVQELNVWEDRDEHVKEFQALEDTIPHDVTVHHVKK